MKSKVVPIRMSEELLDLVSICSKAQRTDRATTMRQWLYKGAEEYAIDSVEAGRLSASRAAELLDTSIHEIFRIAKARGIRLGATAEQYRASKRYADEFLGDGPGPDKDRER